VQKLVTTVPDTKIPFWNRMLELSRVVRWEMGVAHITGSFATCPEMVSPTAARDMRVFNEMEE
jgi:hypothetical protein